MNELLRPTRENYSGSGSAGTLFADDEEESPQLVTVSSGPYAEHLPVGNMSVGEIRRRFRDRLDIDPRSVAVLDGRDVRDDVVVTAAHVLTFMHRAGEKGNGAMPACSAHLLAAVPLICGRQSGGGRAVADCKSASQRIENQRCARQRP